MIVSQGTNRQEEKEKLKLLQHTESMRHLQALEATEMGFVIAAFGFLIGALLGRIHQASNKRLGCLTFWVLAAVASLTAPLLVRHFRGRRETYYWVRRKYHTILRELGWAEHVKPGESLFGFGMRIGIICTLSVALIFIAWSVTQPGRTNLIIALTVFCSVLVLEEPRDRRRRAVRGLCEHFNHKRTAAGRLCERFSRCRSIRPVVKKLKDCKTFARICKKMRSCQLLGWLLTEPQQLRVDPKTPVTIRHADRSLEEDVPYWQIRYKLRRGDEATIGERPLPAPGPHTWVAMQRRDQALEPARLRDLDNMVRYGDRITVGKAEKEK